jgi:hypothetical protein
MRLPKKEFIFVFGNGFLKSFRIKDFYKNMKLFEMQAGSCRLLF